LRAAPGIPLHMPVGTEVFDHDKSQTLIKALSVVVEYEDHVAQWLANSDSLVNQATKQQRANAAILKLRQ
jgi:hypothetical protein